MGRKEDEKRNRNGIQRDRRQLRVAGGDQQKAGRTSGRRELALKPLLGTGLVEQFLGVRGTTATVRCNAQALPKLAHGLRAIAHSFANLAIGDGVAQTDIHAETSGAVDYRHGKTV